MSSASERMRTRVSTCYGSIAVYREQSSGSMQLLRLRDDVSIYERLQRCLVEKRPYMRISSILNLLHSLSSVRDLLNSQANTQD